MDRVGRYSGGGNGSLLGWMLIKKRESQITLNLWA